MPIPNAYELYRGLQDRKVPWRLIVYKGFGHGINKPKERLAAIWHNWQWFNKYVFGEKEEPMPAEYTKWFLPKSGMTKTTKMHWQKINFSFVLN